MNAGEGAHTGVRVGGEIGRSERAPESDQGPDAGFGERYAVLRRKRRFDELRLPARVPGAESRY